MMEVAEFYELCVNADIIGDLLFGSGAECLNCGWRIGSHGEGEFERCALEYQEES